MDGPTVPDRPSQKVGADLFVSGGKDNIVVTGYYSLHPKDCRLHTTTAQTVIASMKAIFARHCVPSEVFTNNGPQFNKKNSQSLPQHGTLLTQLQVLTTRFLMGQLKNQSKL